MANKIGVKKRHYEYHGSSSSPEYEAWRNMIHRCYHRSYRSYHRYGGRGINVCDRWKLSFKSFYDDMGERPSRNHSLDRIDYDDGYYKENCRWATNVEQYNNRSTSHRIEYNGKIMNITEWSKEVGIPRGTISSRIRYGWPIERILKK